MTRQAEEPVGPARDVVESEQRYRALFENMAAGFVLFEVVGTEGNAPQDLVILAANRWFEQATGLALSQSLGQRLRSVLPGIEHDSADWIGRYGRIALDGGSAEFRDYSAHLDKHFLVTAYQPVRGQCAVTFVDVTAQARAEEERERLLSSEREARERADTARRHYQALFETAPGAYLVLRAKDEVIVALSEAYLAATMTTRAALLGRALFSAFPDDPEDPAADGVRNLRSSLERVKESHRSDVMGVQRFPIRRPEEQGGGWEERYWSPVNTPVFGPDGEVEFIIHRVEDVSEYLRLHRNAASPGEATAALESRADQLAADIVLRSQELRRARDELAQSQSLLRIAGRAARFGGWRYDVETSEVQWSDEVCRIHDRPPGHQPSLAEGIEYYHPTDRSRVEAAVTACLVHGEAFQLEARIVTARGRDAWILAIGEAVRDSAGRIVAVQGAAQDVTARREAEQSAAESQRRFQTAADLMPIFVWSAAADGVVDYANAPYSRYSGVAADANLATRWIGTLHPDDRDGCIARWVDCVATGQTYDYEFRIRNHADGSYRWFRAQAEPARDTAGRILRWHGTAIDIHDLKTLEREATRLAARLATTLESLTDAFVAIDADGVVVFANAAAERLLRRGTTPLQGTALPDLLPTGALRGHSLAEVLGDEGPMVTEILLPETDIWVELRAFRSDDGHSIILRDVSERVRSRAALQESEERFRLLSRATNDAIWDWNLLSNELWWGEGLELLSGYDRLQEVPHIESWTEKIHPDDRDEILASIHAAIDGDAQIWMREYRFGRRDGSWAYVVDRGLIIREADGKATRMVGGMTDLTERKQAEELLREQATLLDQAHDAILVRDLEHRIQFWNRGAERLYGWTAEAAHGRLVSELIYRDDNEFLTATQAVLEAGEWMGELRQYAKDGTPIDVRAHWTLLRDKRGAPRSILAINTDVTDRKRLEQQFLRAQRMESIGTLAGGIAHDLNNILSPILMSIELLKMSDETGENADILDTLYRSAKRGAEMVSQVLSFARGMDGQRVSVNLHSVVTDLLKITHDTFPKNVELVVEIPDDLWPLEADPTQMHQVLLNLCVNARDAMPLGGRITIRAENMVVDEQYAAMNIEARVGPHIRLEVEDTGTGIPAAIIEKVFDPFFTTKGPGKGTGLGLSTTLAIVKSHGGFIRAYSDANIGAKFRIYLPAGKGSQDLEGPSARLLPRGSGEVVLVVDDEASIRQITKQTLEAFGYRVLLAADGADGVATYVAHQREIAVVLTDMMMPVMDGPALIRALRQLNPSLRIIGASGITGNGKIAQASGAGVKHFLPKPYTADTLLKALRVALDEH